MPTGYANNPPRKLRYFTGSLTTRPFVFSRGSPTKATQLEGDYTHRDSGRAYTPHHDAEQRFVFDDAPRYALAKGGEGGGKSVAGIIKTLERLRRGMSGIMVSPDLPHFRRSLWPEFVRWCPPTMVLAAQRYRLRFDWEPREPFMMAFTTGATLLCGGIEEPGAYEGPNVHFAYFDEARRAKTATALKVLDGRARLVGPDGALPQVYLTTTPRKHWLYEYFGPWDRPTEADPLADFKANALVIDLFTADNAQHLAPGWVQQRRQSLTEAEARVLLDAAWEDIDETERYLPTIALWDACQAVLPPLDAHTPLVLAADAGVSNDCFGLVGVSRHPERHDDVAVRLVRLWEPHGQPLDFPAIEQEIRQLHAAFSVVQFCYDPYQLHQMAQQLGDVLWCDAFGQQQPRLEADKLLLDLIQARRITHDGNAQLRTHLDNADRKTDPESRKLRIVKRSPGQKVDLSVALSMAAARCVELNL